MEELPPELIHCIMCYLNPREAVLMLMASNRFNTFSRNGYVELLKGCMRDNMYLGEPPFERIRYLQLSSDVLMKLVEHLEAFMNGDYVKDHSHFDTDDLNVGRISLCIFCDRLDAFNLICGGCFRMICDFCGDDRLAGHCVNMQFNCYYCLIKGDCECAVCKGMRTQTVN